MRTNYLCAACSHFYSVIDVFAFSKFAFSVSICVIIGIKMMLILLLMKKQNQGPYMEWSSPLTLMHEWPSLSTARLLRSSPMGWHCKDSCMFNVVWTDIHLMSLQNKVATDLTYCDVHLNVTNYGQRKHVGCELGSMHWLLIGFWDVSIELKSKVR